MIQRDRRFELVQVSGDPWSMKSVRHYELNGVYVDESLIPWDHTSCTRVYFVSGTNGDEFGQFPALGEAMVKARAMSSLSQAERRKFDE